MREAVIVSSVRTAVGKAGKGMLSRTRPDDMAAAVIKGALARVPAVTPEMIEDVILGCAMPEAEQGMNVARIASLLAGIPYTAGAMTVTPSARRACRRSRWRGTRSAAAAPTW